MNNELTEYDTTIKYCHKCGASYTHAYVDSRIKDIYYNMKSENKEICYFCGNKLNENPFTINDEFDKELVDKRQEKLIKMKQHDDEGVAKFFSDRNIGQTPINIPKCPICGSTNLSKISALHKAGKIGLFGIFGMGDNGKTWKCNGCGSKF